MTRAERAEGVVLVVIMLTVGTLAGAASFTHVHDWTMDNSPAGTGDWFGWANAAISELIPIAALLTIRRRRRSGGSITYPMLLLICAVALSLSAQLAVAKPGISGWLLSAVPALAFMGLSKLVLSGKPAKPAAPAPAPAASAAWIPADRETTVAAPTRATPQADADQPAAPEPAPRPKSNLVPVPALAFARPNAEVAR
ncbi:DUF2637 domain-containing protein [Catenuloplanes sp. NPDC051500]|uniref:DUF2637 domain-containing protein n=1 Tax=Catenuloplanes sp. NPDC051500 TaxID=3363959 RepID=UPI0037B0609C